MKEINEKWEKEYNFLEDLRQSGITNMFGATPYLVKAFKISENKAFEILGSWMDNYKELSKKYNWQ